MKGVQPIIKTARASIRWKKELEDVAGEFDAIVTKELPAVNKSLSQKKLEPIHPMERKAWEAADADSGAGAPGAAKLFRERD